MESFAVARQLELPLLVLLCYIGLRVRCGGLNPSLSLGEVSELPGSGVVYFFGFFGVGPPSN